MVNSPVCLAAEDSIYEQTLPKLKRDEALQLSSQLDLVRRAVTLHNNPCGARKPKGLPTPTRPFMRFSKHLRSLFDSHHLPPYEIVDENAYLNDPDGLTKAYHDMREKGGRQISKYEKMSIWGEDALKRLQEKAIPQGRAKTGE